MTKGFHKHHIRPRIRQLHPKKKINFADISGYSPKCTAKTHRSFVSPSETRMTFGALQWCGTSFRWPPCIYTLYARNFDQLNLFIWIHKGTLWLDTHMICKRLKNRIPAVTIRRRKRLKRSVISDGKFRLELLCDSVVVNDDNEKLPKSVLYNKQEEY